MSDWVSINDEMPNVDKNPDYDCEYVYVIVAKENGNVKPMIYERAVLRGKTVYRWKEPWEMIYYGNDITHWMPLPEAPQHVSD